MVECAHQLISMKLLNCRVCSSGTEEEALEWVRVNSPAGTILNWGSYDYKECPEMAPLTCVDNPTRTHYMFCC